MDFIDDERIRRETARWYARLRAPDCSDADRASFRCWRQQHSRHGRACAEAEAIESQIEAVREDPKWQALAEEAFEAARVDHDKARSSWRVPAALAAGFLAAILGIFYAGVFTHRIDEAVAYTSATGVESITLSDGSTVRLDVNTQIAVRIADAHREVTLLSGRAMFDVAHDPARPFSVRAEGSRTTALGTRFQVERQEQRVLVVLEEGSVNVERELAGGESAAWHERLHPGEQLAIDSVSGTHEKTSIDAQLATSWTVGRHVFRATPLEDAVEQINRYAKRKVRLGDPTLAEFPVAGNFIVGDSEQIVSALAAVLPLRVVASGDGEIILFRQYDIR